MANLQKRVSSILAVLMAICILVSTIPSTAYALQADEGGQPNTENAVAVAPKQLALDGSKSYVIFTACVWGGHTYGIGPDATATKDLKISLDNFMPGSAIHLAQEGLGWSLNQTREGLVIQNQGRYLTVSGDGKNLVVSDREMVSGLAINENGVLALVDDASKTVYLQRSEHDPEPQPGQQFGITGEQNATVFRFAEIQESVKPSTDVLFPTLLPQKNFRAKIVPPDQVYGDDQYVIFTMNGGQPIAITSGARCSSPLVLDKAPAVGVTLSSPDQNTLWTVNNNRAKSAESGYYKYIRSCASNKYLAANNSLLDGNAKCDFYLADKDGTSALLATGDGRYVTLNGNTFSVTNDRNAAARFYFAKLLLDELQKSGSTTEIPRGNLLRLVDWSSIEDGKTYAIISATEFNKMHYALSGNGRLARYGADNLTQNSICPNENANGLYGVPCEAAKNDIFYTNGQDILWTVSVSGTNKAAFKNINTNLYLKPSEGTAAEQTPSVSTQSAVITIEPVNGQVYAYLRSDAGKYLGIWQYISVGVAKNADERCAYYLAEVLNTNDIKDLPATALEKDWDRRTVSFGGLYSIYQGSQHLLTDGTGVENFILMNDGTGSFKPSSPEYKGDGKDNYYVTYCADWEAEMPSFTNPGQYKAVSLEDYDGFTTGQKALLAAIIPHCYPYVTKDAFLSELKKAGFEVSKDCGTDEILAGIQAVIYTITNPREDGNPWGYESSDGWAHNSFEVNKPNSYVADPAQAERDVNTVRDYLWTYATPAAATSGMTLRTVGADSGFTELEGDYFAITTKIGEHIWALGYPSNYGTNFHLLPYDPDDIRQMWCKDEHGCLRWVPYVINHGLESEYAPCLDFSKSIDYDNHSFAWSTYDVTVEARRCYGDIPVTFDETTGRLMLNDYENKLSTIPWKANKLLNIEVDPWYLQDEDERYNNGWSMGPVVHSIFDSGTNKLTFTKEPATPRFPHFIDYDIKDSDWQVTDNGNGTYNITVSGHLNFPVRDGIDYIGVIMSPEREFPSDYDNYYKWYPVTPGTDEFTFTVDSIPDSQEAHFCLMVGEEYRGIEVFVPQNTGWQIQIGSTVNQAYKEIHEMTTSITAKKAWADEEDHSGDKVELCLMENGKETSYKIELSEKSNWEGKFKHVPYKRWTYTGYGPYVEDIVAIPLESHQYTVKELNPKPGYAPIYTLELPDGSNPDPLTPGKSYPVQAVYTTSGGEELTLNFLEGIVEYIQGDENQRYFLNGNDTLVTRLDDKRLPLPAYVAMGFEPANVAGKYYIIYQIDPNDGTKYYLPQLDGDMGPTPDKNQAGVFELRNFVTGNVLTTLPTGTFQPIETAFEAYYNGQLTGFAFDIDEGITPYDPANPFQKLRIYDCDGQFVALNDYWMFEAYILPEPWPGATGQYLLRFNMTFNGESGYVGINADGRPQVVDNAGDALRFGLTSFPATDYGAMGKYFQVTNAPGASLEVSKTVSGEGIDPNKAFTFTVTLGDNTITGTFGDMEFQNGVATFTLKHGEKKTATGVPAGTTYEVVETDNDGYMVTVNGGNAADGKSSGNLVAKETAKLAFKNTKAEIPHTGDPANTALWLALLVFSGLVLATLTVSRRKRQGRNAE